MKRIHLLAAEMFGYSYAHYADRLEYGNERFRVLMPNDVRAVEKAVAEEWPLSRLARSLKCNEEEAKAMRDNYVRSAPIVDAPTAAETFRRGVRDSIKLALEEGLASEAQIEKLVVQICYRAADMAFLLDREGVPLSEYSEGLRREDDLDAFSSDEP